MTKQTTTRRAVLAGAAAMLPATAAVALPSIGGPDPYAELLECWRANVAAWAEHARFYREVMDEADRVCPPPETLRALPSDVDFGFDAPLPEGRTHYALSIHQFVGVMRRPPRVLERGHSLTVDHGAPWLAKQERANAVFACYAEWKAKRDALTASLGYDPEAYEAETDALGDEQHEIEEEIAAVPVTTAAETIAKAKLVAEVLRHYDEINGSDYREPEDDMARQLVHSIARLGQLDEAVQS